MTKSTPIASIRPTSNENALPIDNDDVVQDVLQTLNNEKFTMPQASDSIPSYAEMAAAATTPMHMPMNDASMPHSNHILPFAITHDIKLAAICVAVFIAAYQIPLEKIIYSYISLDKLPFSEVIVKGLVAGALFYFLVQVLA